MKYHTSTLCRFAVPAAAIFLIGGAYLLARGPETSVAERAELASHFSFVRQALPELPTQSPRSIRTVNARLDQIAAWVSSVGAAVALNDLDGDGLPDDLCYVDARTNQVVVAPVPGTPARYAPFALDPAPLAYDGTMAPTGCLPGDFVENGQMDLLVTYWGRTPIAFLRKPGTPMGPAGYIPRDIVPGGARWFTNSATQADLTGNGHYDLVLGNYFADGSRILDPNTRDDASMQDSMARSFNGGGPHFLLWQGATRGPEPNVTFDVVDPAAAGLDHDMAHGWTLAVGAADLDKDMLPEIYVANDFGPDLLLYNRSTPGHLRFSRLKGEQTFWTPKSKVLGNDSFKGMGVDFGDLEGRGLFDIAVSNIADSYALEESNFTFINTGEVDRMRDGVAPFVDHSESLGLARSGWAWDIKMDDFDNSGALQVLQATGFLRGNIGRWPDLHELAMGNPELLANPLDWPRFQAGDDLSGHDQNPFYVRSTTGRFVDLASDVGLNEPQVSRGIAVADVFGDGALDFAVANQWGPSSFYRNECPACGAFLGLHLLLPLQAGSGTRERAGHPGPDTPGRPAIGAIATVWLADGRNFIAQVDGGNGHSGKRSNDVHFGLGSTDSQMPVRVDLRWRDPSGSINAESLLLTPGWHTVVLGWPTHQER